MIVVTGVAALVGTAGTTVHAVRRVGGAARAAADRGAALARLHRRLSEDAAAADLVAATGDALTFTLGDGSHVAYAADGPAVTRRVAERGGAGDAGGPGERFAVGAAGTRFAADAGRASVAFDRAGTPDEREDGLAVGLVAYAGGAE